MQDVVDAGRCIVAGFFVSNISLDKLERSPALLTDQRVNLIQIPWVSCRKVVDPNHLLIQAQKFFDKIRTDKAGCSGDEPASAISPQFVTNALEC